MPSDLIQLLLFSLIDLLRGTLLLSVPVFIIVAPACFLRKRLARKYRLDWLKSTFATSYLLVLLLIFVLYFSPIAGSWGHETMGIYPPAFAPAAWEGLAAAALLFLRLVFVALVFEIMLLPMEFFGALLFDWLGKRYAKLNYYIRLYAVVFAGTLISAFLVLFAMKWLPAAVLYMVFYAF